MALENTDEQQKQRLSQNRPQKQKHNTLLKTTFPWIEGIYREPSITKGAKLSSDVGRHKVILKEKHRRNHCQRASGEKLRQNHSQRDCGEKNKVKQQGYEESEKNTKIWSNDEKNR